MRALLFILFFLGGTFRSLSQSALLSQAHGARSHGIGSVRLFLPDSWSYFNNIGALARVDESGVAVGYDSRFGLKDLQTVSLASHWKNSWGSVGMGISRFGGNLFNQQSLGLGFSNQLGIISFGGKLDWFQTQIEEFGTGNSLLFTIGGVAELSPQVFLSANFSNLNRAKISRESVERLPTIVQMGFSYIPINNLQLHLEIEKGLETSASVRAGIEYRIQEWVSLRTGIKTNPGDLFFGIGLNPKQFDIDYAFGQNTALGSTHHLSLGFRWQE